MKDRVSTYPGRVKLTPVSGQENVYDLERWDSPTEPGTPLNKANLLSDLTAELLGGTSSMTPNEAFQVFCKHYWRKSSIVYKEAAADDNGITANTYSSNYADIGPKSGTYTVVQYGTSITVSSSGSISIDNPTSLTINSTNAGTTLSGKYFKITTKGTYCGFSTNTIYRAPSSWSFSTSTTYNSAYACQKTFVIKIIPVAEGSGDYTLVSSVIDTAYPNPSGTSGGYYYEYIGTPLKRSIDGMSIEKGRYLGTGTTGSGSPCSITFAKTPVLVWITGVYVGTSYANASRAVFDIQRYTSEFNTSYPSLFLMATGTNSALTLQSGSDAKIVGKTLSWYGATAEKQMNIGGYEYTWFAIVL